MRSLILVGLMTLLQVCLCLYDTVLVGPTTYLYLRIGQFKKVSLPFNFTTYYSVDVGKSQKSNFNYLSSVCSVEERQFDLQELDFILIKGQNLGYKDVVTQYDTLVQKRFLIDMVVSGNLLYLVYTDAIKIVTLDISNNNVGKISKSFDFDTKITAGKLIKVSNTTLYFIGSEVIYQISNSQATKLEGYNQTDDFQSAVMTNQKTFLIATRRNGILIYRKQQGNQINHLISLSTNFFEQEIDISDIVIDQSKKMIYVLNRLGSIIRLQYDPNDPLQSLKHVYNINRSGCQNMEYFNDQIYITCPELHRLTFFGEGIIDKAFQNPNFKPKSIIFFNSIIILVGHNLAKIYNEGVEMGYYHDFLMRKIYALGDKILIGSDYGVSLTDWDVSELEITCGLKRKGATQKYEGKVSTTIDVVAQCNQQYFKENNITYKDQLKNDICLYHFPISIDFWVGKQINYLPFKLGVMIIIIVCLAVLLAWFILNKKVKSLTNAIKQYAVITPTSSKPAYINMIEEDGTDHNTQKQSVHDHNIQQQLHQIGD